MPAIAAPKPNLITIYADDMGYNDSHVYGSPIVSSPSIDRLAAEGVRATTAYSAQSKCAPSRAALMTGRYPHRYGFEENPKSTNPEHGLPADEMTIAEVLRPAGYATGLIGKWHQGNNVVFRPDRHGFDYFYGFWKGCCHSYLPIAGDQPIVRNYAVVPDPAYTTVGFGTDALSFIEAHRSEPFYLHVAFNAVHGPVQAPAIDKAKYPNVPEPKKTYVAALTAMDTEIGRIMAKVDTLDRPTLIIFMSDNGSDLNSGKDSNKPWLGKKATLYEGGIRIPFIARGAGLPAGKVVTQTISLMDVLPTFAALAQPPPKLLDGVNIWPLLTGASNANPHPTLFWRHLGASAVRDGDRKWLRLANGTGKLYDVSGMRETPISEPATSARLRGLLDDWETHVAIPPRWHE